ncbi:hypothetical protein SPRG_05409 [Saprolegnia parasitica CBS 223.65]|uniref:Uncharacterized protein n=1 Tax=Saprolegnia parasitica (strain CBS 223.65) TaxID=695850 RepID=A0A067CJ30_SAPPC|nr:hypothetical protein SPRG_05409 [Saprolegnia parasitica CBS 223.65]KDO29165.1 hypothetical protein SPRG_05409 [Saprolegnia parasitica CBS 223.65]|eukprot:XP_012200044.1 hypothetical protein SPRG_05409 [Saprolegnia parasitica CBS 223.65]
MDSSNSSMLKDKWALDAKALDKDIQNLNVALAELDSVKPKKATYVQRCNVFFVQKRDLLVKAKKAELEAKQAERHRVGLALRNAE